MRRVRVAANIFISHSGAQPDDKAQEGKHDAYEHKKRKRDTHLVAVTSTTTFPRTE